MKMDHGVAFWCVKLVGCVWGEKRVGVGLPKLLAPTLTFGDGDGVVWVEVPLRDGGAQEFIGGPRPGCDGLEDFLVGQALRGADLLVRCVVVMVAVVAAVVGW